MNQSFPDFLSEAAELESELTSLREAFHRRPELGNQEFKTAERIEQALRACGLQSASPSWTELAASAAAAYTLSAATTYALKHTCHEQRPDDSDCRSFPSGHATFAFAGATVLMKEYGRRSPWIAVGGYTLATLVAADRVRRDRHYVHDVVAGAAIGFAATELTYYLKRKVIKSRNIDLSLSGLQLDVAVRW